MSGELTFKQNLQGFMFKKNLKKLAIAAVILAIIIFLGVGVGKPGVKAEEDIVAKMMSNTMWIESSQYVRNQQSKTVLERHGYKCLLYSENEGENLWPKARLEVVETANGYKTKWHTVTQPLTGEGGTLTVIYWYGLRITIKHEIWIT